MAAVNNSEQKDQRRKFYAAIHATIHDLGMDDENYRDILHLRYKVNSSTKLHITQLRDLLTYLKGPAETKQREDARARARATRPDKPVTTAMRKEMINKIEALLAEKGKAENTPIPWNYAKAILKKQSKVERLEWATPDQLRGVISALYRDAVRKGRKTAAYGQ
ncbi:MAG: regulatory protein GemA [Desulfarculales bacterium]|jgi:phage gp16-like protein|nr:regulatory protein GemA [Desulfarculales bacterium]